VVGERRRLPPTLVSLLVRCRRAGVLLPDRSAAGDSGTVGVMVDDRPPPLPDPLPDPSLGAGPGGPPPAPLPDPDQRVLDAEAEELRRQVRAGAGTPEELRALAERLRAHREREQEVWRRSVKPGLKRPGSASPDARRNVAIILVLAVGVCAVIAAVILAST
jgi:hypothetical protein